MLPRILLVLDDRALRRQLRATLAQPDIIVHALRSAQRLWERAPRGTSDLIVIGRSLMAEPPEEMVRVLRELPELPAIVVLWDGCTPEQEASLLAAGCQAVLGASLSVEQLCEVLQAIVGRRRQAIDRRFAVSRDVARPRLSDFVSASAAMQAFMRFVSRVVDSEASLLLLGETGVGKERLARAIHAEGPRAQGPFVTVNCGALPEALLESELFGHEEGAFTGATRSRRGMFELAHGGTLFLDEIGEMPYHLQVKLLRAVQEHEIQPVGSEKATTIDVRVMAATNCDLAQDVDAGEFRRDLYYRLSVVSLTVPPLRERRQDIPELVDSYIDYFSTRIGGEVSGIASDALDALGDYAWPGNVRELINVIERAMLLADDDEIALEDLPAAIGHPHGPPAASFRIGPDAHTTFTIPEPWLADDLRAVRRRVVHSVERAYLAGLLQATGGRIGDTATRAGIDPRSLYDKMKAHGLRKEDFKPPRDGP